MAIPLRVVILEDNPSDAELMLHALRQAGYNTTASRVETEDDYRQQLLSVPDIVLADFSMPEFDALSALDILRENHPDIPFIIVSGSIGEDNVVQFMRRGASDYIIKDRMGRLGYAVTQALEQRRLRDAKGQAERTLSESNALSHNIQEASKQAQEKAVAINEALTIESLHQRDLTEAAVNLNVQLRAEIAERKLAEAALRESEDRYRSLFASAPMAVFVCDQFAVIQQYNHRAVELWGREPVRGVERHCGSLKLLLSDGTFLPHDQSPIVEVLRTGVSANNVEVLIERPDGSRLPVLVNFAALKDARGAVTGAITSFIDITQRRALETSLAARIDELASADRSKDEFLAMLAHELRNPLAPLRGAAEILRLKNFDDPVVARVQVILERQVSHMTRLVDDLLDTSRIKQRKVKLHIQKLDFASSVFAVLDGVRDSINRSNHTLTVSIENTPPLYIDADPARIAQIISNLVINAVKYTPQNGAIHVSAGREGNMAVLRVRDNGIGLESHMLKAVFDLFTQVEVSLERSQGGLGLGLKLVQELVEMQGGTVEATSAGKNKGCEFIVRFPESIIADLLLPPVEVIIPGLSRRILLIEDNADILECIQFVLTLNGHTVEVAENGSKGVEKALRGGFDVALVDIGLPGMSGYEVAKTIRGHPAGVGMVLIAMTGYGDQEDKRRAREAGFDEHLTKPIAPGDLEIILNELEKYQQQTAAKKPATVAQ